MWVIVYFDVGLGFDFSRSVQLLLYLRFIVFEVLGGDLEFNIVVTLGWRFLDVLSKWTW